MTMQNIAQEIKTAQFWYVPFTQEELHSAYTPLSVPGSEQIVTAQHFTVKLMNVYIAEEPRRTMLDKFLHKSRATFICSETAMGATLNSARFHHYAEPFIPKKLLRNFLADAIFVAEDYSGKDDLWLNLKVLDVPGNPPQCQPILDTFNSMNQTFGGIFPPLLPFMTLTSKVTEAVFKLFNTTNTTQALLDISLRLSPKSHNAIMLRPGSYVVFNKMVVGSNYRLGRNGVLLDSENQSPVENIAYAVFNIELDSEAAPELVLSQHVSSLLTKIKAVSAQNDSTSNITATKDFLTTLVQGSNNFKLIKRYVELSTKPELSAEEIKRLNEIRQNSELKPYLPASTISDA